MKKTIRTPELQAQLDQGARDHQRRLIRQALDGRALRRTLPAQGLIIDLFAGGGGTSTGILQALGRSPDIVLDFNAEALAIHAANHPDAQHVLGDIRSVDPLALIGGRHVELMTASPPCTDFTPAKGKAQRDLNRITRQLPWTVVQWAAILRPRVIVVENVTAMGSWGPLQHPGEGWRDYGSTYNNWFLSLCSLGYQADERHLDAADFGAPTHRRRLFSVFRLDGMPTIPEPTHGPGLLPYVTASQVFDWSNLGDLVTPGRLSATTEGKITRALVELGSTAPNGNRSALVQYNGKTLGRPITRPLGTLTTGSTFGLAQRTPDGTLHYRMLTTQELLVAQGFPTAYQLPGTKAAASRIIGNSVSPLIAAAVIRSVFAKPRTWGDAWVDHHGEADAISAYEIRRSTPAA